MYELKPSEFDLKEDRSMEIIEPENTYVETEACEEIATRKPRECCKVTFCVHQNLTQLLDAIFPGTLQLEAYYRKFFARINCNMLIQMDIWSKS
jgi:hypothetical protein